ncbi:MAG TPA: RpiB/LacA/LacB family sugar-phosphate isomerase, partial [Anaerolineae bacterium]|nr:RpiB/LacA/LacB family sugar-phosphate isomerase [Anaerolineae bacterium]
MADPRLTSADEVRALVRKVVDDTLGASSAMPAVVAVARAAVADDRVAVAVAGDHGGWRMKDAIGAWLTEHGYAVRDCGTHSDDAVDYPDLALAVA